MKRVRKAFTLIELLVVMSIMALLGTMSVTAYRSMQQAMADNAALRSASQFIRLSYQRSQIDRVPVNVYFWNEFVQEETDAKAGIVVGRAIAVRRQGRVSMIDKNLLIDEFGDLDVFASKDEDDETEGGIAAYKSDAGMYLYKINGRENSVTDTRSLVSRTTGPFEDPAVAMISHPDDDEDGEYTKLKTITAYGFWVQDGTCGIWQKGDAYGLEFGDFSLPNNYIFSRDFASLNESNPVKYIDVFNFNPMDTNDGSSKTIVVSAIRSNSSGDMAAFSMGSTTSPGSNLRQQNSQ